MSNSILEFCPLGKRCLDGVTRCKWYINHPVVEQNGESKDDWRCAQIWPSVLLIELLNMMALNSRDDYTKIVPH